MNTPTSVAASPPVSKARQPAFAGRRAALLISTLLLGVLSFQLNASMVTPALPQIAASFGQSADSAAPVQSMFFLAGAIAGPVIGRWSDFIGRRAALLLVLGIMGAGTILCIAAPTLPLLIAGRFLQGVSSAVFALAYIVLSENLQAKVFGTSLGHHNETQETDEFLDLVARGLLWTCDKLDDDGKPLEGYGPK